MMSGALNRPEVQVASGGVVRLGTRDVKLLHDCVLGAERKRARICAHPSTADPLHEMIICLARDTYIRPHRHAGKSESFHIIDGELDVVLFDDDGAIREVIRMGPYGSRASFFYRLMEPCFHTVLVRTPLATFHETTNGPFYPGGTEFAAWAPADGDEAHEYQRRLRVRVRS
jgi:cupin fold WbuC family metalloprotein